MTGWVTRILLVAAPAFVLAAGASAQTVGSAYDLDAAIAADQQERADLLQMAQDPTVLYTSAGPAAFPLPVRRDGLERFLTVALFLRPGATVEEVVADLLRSDRAVRQALQEAADEITKRIAMRNEHLDRETQGATMFDEDYLGQLSFDDYERTMAGGGMLEARLVRMDSHGRQSGRDMYTVHLELANRGGKELTFKTGMFYYTVYDPPGSKMNEQRISYRVADLGPGKVTGIGNSCEAPPPMFQGSWHANGTAEDPDTGFTYGWKISGTCP